MSDIIFHIPVEIDRKIASASQIRPLRMIEAFQDLGYSVDIIEGYGKQRKEKIKKIKKKIREGTKYSFLYSEASTMPTLLTEASHLPIHPFLDFNFFKFCKKHSIKIALFYRDIYWAFEKKKRFKQFIANLFYLYDLKKYNQLVDVFYVPSRKMLEYIPICMKMRVETLPPGALPHIRCKKQNGGYIHILYVGGIGNHYHLETFVKNVLYRKKIKLTVCCRAKDWKLVERIYAPYFSDNVRFVHAQGEELLHLYESSDLFTLCVKPVEYWSFAVPFKLFEAIGYGCPILASNGTWTAEFVQQHNIGIAIDYTDESISQFLDNLPNNVNILDEYRSRIAEIEKDNTWSARCLQVINQIC